MSLVIMVTFMPVLQIAAKIGGDAGPPVNINAASDGFPFTAPKRQLEDAGSSDHAATSPLCFLVDDVFRCIRCF